MDSKNKVILISVIAGILVIGMVVSMDVSGKAYSSKLNRWSPQSATQLPTAASNVGLGEDAINVDCPELEMDFVTADLRDAGGNYNEMSSVSVLNIRSRDWRNPDYPHKQNFFTLNTGATTDEIYIRQNGTEGQKYDIFYVDNQNDVALLTEATWATNLDNIAVITGIPQCRIWSNYWDIV